MENWKSVVGYGGLYEVSDLGRVRSKRGVLKGVPNGYGHLKVNLYKNGKPSTCDIHRLVALTFLGPCPEGMVVCHGAAGKEDNRLTNISYKTQRENTGSDRNRDHRYSSRFPGVTWHKTDKKWQARIWFNGKRIYLGSFSNEQEASATYQTARANLTKRV
jgi:hypothetical protein